MPRTSTTETQIRNLIERRKKRTHVVVLGVVSVSKTLLTSTAMPLFHTHSTPKLATPIPCHLQHASVCYTPHMDQHRKRLQILHNFDQLLQLDAPKWQMAHLDTNQPTTLFMHKPSINTFICICIFAFRLSAGRTPLFSASKALKFLFLLHMEVRRFRLDLETGFSCHQLSPSPLTTLGIGNLTIASVLILTLFQIYKYFMRTFFARAIGHISSYQGLENKTRSCKLYS